MIIKSKGHTAVYAYTYIPLKYSSAYTYLNNHKGIALQQVEIKINKIPVEKKA